MRSMSTPSRAPSGPRGDGRGGALHADDANLPSVLALPYRAGARRTTGLRATRRLVLSEANPWFARGSVAAGIGSAHTPPGSV